jgi:hypothetical protein
MPASVPQKRRSCHQEVDAVVIEHADSEVSEPAKLQSKEIIVTVK